ncbi:MAG TPA: ABC transporter permease [Vicinamibacterales bacterium]|nr:ABC transporter permease [Vicinamibacterales bacterium]
MTFGAALHRLAMRAYPQSFRIRVGDDLQDTFRRRVAAARERGVVHGVISLGAGLVDTCVSGLAERSADARVRARLAAHHSPPSRSLPMTWESIVSDVTLAFRHIRKSPVFAAMTIATLAVGIGANGAIFSSVYAALLKPLPYAASERLVALWSDQTKLGDSSYPMSPANYDAFKRESTTLAQVEAMYSFLVNLQVPLDDSFETIQVSTVTPGMFSLLGRQAMLGRGLQEGDEQNVVLSHSYWQRRFGSDRSIVGKTLAQPGGHSLTIVGVMPDDFTFPYRSMLGPSGFSRAQTADVWRLLSPRTEARLTDATGQPNRTIHFFSVIGRLKDGVTMTQAVSELKSLAARRASDFPESNEGYGVTVRPLLDQTVGKIRPALILLTTGVGVILLLTCVSIANVLLARASTQQRDQSVRAALGASRARLLQQTLAESVVLSCLGGLAAILVVALGTSALLAIAPPDLPRVTEARITWQVAGFIIGLSLAVGLVTGFLPAISSARTKPEDSLRDSQRNTATAGQRMMRSVLVVTEVMLATFLAIGAGLLLRSFAAVLSVNPGFAVDHVLTFQVSVPARYSTIPARIEFYDELRSKLSSLPGVASVGGSTRMPLGSTQVSTQLTVEGRTVRPTDLPEVQMRRSVHDFFGTLRIPVIEGRVFTDEDRSNGERVAVINAALAAKVFANESPLGKRVQMGPNPTPDGWLRIIGVVGSVRHSSLEETPQPEIYISHLQGPPVGPFMAIRTTGDPAALAAGVRSTLKAMNVDPPSSVHTMDELRSESVGERRFVLWLVGAFGVVALLVAGIGVYGVISLSVAERRSEVGVRLALGARPSQVWSMLVGQAAMLGAIGVVIGVVAAFVMTPLAAALLFGISPADPLTFAGVATLLMLIAIAAGALPARRAMKVDPATALRS